VGHIRHNTYEYGFVCSCFFTSVLIYTLNPEFSHTVYECMHYVCGYDKLIVGVLIGVGFDVLIAITIGMLILISRIKIAKCERR